MTAPEHHRYQFLGQAALARLRVALALERTLTHLGPSDIVRPSPSAHRHPARIAHAHRAAHLAAPNTPFEFQASR